MSHDPKCKICPPVVEGIAPVDPTACAATLGCQNERTAAFLAHWRAFAESLTDGSQAKPLLPRFRIRDPQGFVEGYAEGIRSKCDEIETSSTMCLDWSGSVGRPVGYSEGCWRGENDCLRAFNYLVRSALATAA